MEQLLVVVEDGRQAARGMLQPVIVNMHGVVLQAGHCRHRLLVVELVENHRQRLPAARDLLHRGRQHGRVVRLFQGLPKRMPQSVVGQLLVGRCRKVVLPATELVGAVEVTQQHTGLHHRGPRIFHLIHQAARHRLDIELAITVSDQHHPERQRLVVPAQAVHAAGHLILHRRENDVVIRPGAAGDGRRLKDTLRRTRKALALGLYLTDQNVGRDRGHRHPSRLGPARAVEDRILVAGGHYLGEHDQRRAYQARTANQLVGTAVGVNLIDFQGRDVERVDGSALTGVGVAGGHAGEIIGILLALAFHFLDQLAVQIQLAQGLGGLYEEIGLPAHGAGIFIGPAMPVAGGETIDWYAVEQEFLERAIDNIVDAACLHALLVVGVTATQVLTLKLAACRVTIYLEG